MAFTLPGFFVFCSKKKKRVWIKLPKRDFHVKKLTCLIYIWTRGKTNLIKDWYSMSSTMSGDNKLETELINVG